LSLGDSQFLVFQYKGNSLFNVIVFGKSGLEIKYPLGEASEEFDESDCSLKMIENPSSLRSKRLKLPSPSYNICKKIKINSKEQKEYQHEKRKVQAQARFPKFKDIDNGWFSYIIFLCFFLLLFFYCFYVLLLKFFLVKYSKF
jgi:hypothetical protein